MSKSTYTHILQTLFLLSIFIIAISAQTLSITVSNGTIFGSFCSSPFVNVVAYLGIPFAQPPIGTLRWNAPISYNSTYPNGTINATTFAPSCYQFGSFATEPPPYSEDCLHLNVWAPANATQNSSLPVKVWIYGGNGYEGSSSDPLYNGCGIATDAIVVSMNYRLGPLGWLTLGAPLNFTGNYGVLDVLMALQWVQENIASFGGNKSTVLLFGQATGGLLAHILSTLPQAKGLFSSVISESGSGRVLTTSEQQIANGNQFVQALGCFNASDVAGCLRMQTPDQIIQATPTLPSILLYLPTQFYAHVDGNIIPVQPLATSPKVPFMAGTCTMEGILFAFQSFTNPLNVTSVDYNNYLNITFGAALVSNISAIYPVSMFNSTVAPALYAIAAVLTDAEYACPTRRALKTSLTTQLGTYTYLWNHVPSCPWVSGITTDLLSYLGATHTSELPFVFGERLGLPQPNGTCNLSASEQILSTEMMTAWQSMSINGYPTLANGSKWLDWSQGGQGVLVNVSLTFSTINRTQCDFWDAIQTVTTTTTTTTNNTTLMTSSITVVKISSAASYDGSTTGFILATFFILLRI
ncbi:unnamed protein product [Adineta steineri]|uniref:Carboxylesterase type B domain-containing protein n=2 Tax=Adineta steineri TaxID=433720 RepID=A0A814ZLM7_9BILA|nr:unnamed protein product [Adineta steineri]